jgi:hypothetical protein
MESTKFKKERNKRYYLHNKLRNETTAILNPYKRTIYIKDDGEITSSVDKLRDVYGYSVQYQLT